MSGIPLQETSQYKAALRDLRALEGHSKRAEREKREVLDLREWCVLM